ncbi:MAG: hypothetical protein IT233_12660 [Bacteroidia bacterium]|nr:hypothetical protein [Bacteroidia bacterium]
MKEFVDNWGILVGFIGGTLGIISIVLTIVFNLADYRKNHISEPNKVLFNHEFGNLPYALCFRDNDPRLINNHNYFKICQLTRSVIAARNDGIRFKGICPRVRFFLLYRSANNFNKTQQQFDQFLELIEDAYDDRVLTEYQKRQKEILALEKCYRNFYMGIFGHL